MRIGEVIGRVTLSRCHPTVQGGIWKLVVPLSRVGIEGESKGRGEPLVAFDDLGTGNGARIALSEGAEAAAPFDNGKPIDAYVAALLDSIELIPAS